MPNIQGGAPEVERWKVKFLQLNLGRGKEAQNSAWYQYASGRTGILVCSPDLSIADFLETDAGFVWVEVTGVRVYSCYFSPNDPFEIFEA